MTRESLTQEYLKEALDYDPETGIFRWKERPRHHFKKSAKSNAYKTWNSRWSGKECGRLDTKGYLYVSINYKHYRQHRLAWLYMTGEWPAAQIDHINHMRLDNRFKNLRVVTNTENGRNSRLSKNNTSGISGVRWRKDIKKWSARIMVNKKEISLGSFSSKQEAIEARNKANKKYDFHPNHGEP